MSRILLVGAGKMGGALYAGWRSQGIDGRDILVVDPAAASAGDPPGALADAGRIPADFHPDIVVLAVKPQLMDSVLPDYRRFGDALFLSIAAGKTLGYFARQLGSEARLVRAMPNTPASIGRGMTVLVASPTVRPESRALAGRLMEAVGEVAWIEDEDLMDAVTGLSGSGPAYVFLLAETMAAAGEAAGLEPGLAARLARATVAGAGELLRLSPESPARLRENVTSPNGTTHAALTVLMAEDGMAPLMTRAVLAASRRSKELAG